MKQQNAGLVNPFRNISFTFVLGPQVKEAASTEIVPSSMTPGRRCAAIQNECRDRPLSRFANVSPVLVSLQQSRARDPLTSGEG